MYLFKLILKKISNNKLLIFQYVFITGIVFVFVVINKPPSKQNFKELEVKSHLVNVNEAELSELDSLEGVGEATALKIIQNRPYDNINDLLSKKILSKSLFEKIKKKIEI